MHRLLIISEIEIEYIHIMYDSRFPKTLIGFIPKLNLDQIFIT